jgi:16S rRNA (guanine(527)-N(7))-methyltransferase RsmG
VTDSDQPALTPEERAQHRVERLIERADSLGIAIEDPGYTAATLLAYQHEMLVENRQVNLTAIRDPDRADVLHALDGLAFGLTGLDPQDVLDIGTGNGFPGVAIACLHPAATVTLIDKTAKKIRAIQSALEAIEFDHVEARQLDAEQAPALAKDWRERFDVITSRATAPIATIARWAAPLCARAATLVLWVQPDPDDPLQHEAPKGYEFQRSIDYTLPALHEAEQPQEAATSDGTRTRRLLLLRRR